MVNVSQAKSLRLAIQLNLVFPGFGYFYIGKGIFGIAAILLIIGIWATTGLVYPVVARAEDAPAPRRPRVKP